MNESLPPGKVTEKDTSLDNRYVNLNSLNDLNDGNVQMTSAATSSQDEANCDIQAGKGGNDCKAQLDGGTELCQMTSVNADSITGVVVEGNN